MPELAQTLSPNHYTAMVTAWSPAVTSKVYFDIGENDSPPDYSPPFPPPIPTVSVEPCTPELLPNKLPLPIMLASSSSPELLESSPAYKQSGTQILNALLELVSIVYFNFISNYVHAKLNK